MEPFLRSLCHVFYSEFIYDGTSKRKFVNRTVQSFSLFKDGITPEWEDVANAAGGEWCFKQRKNIILRVLNLKIFMLLIGLNSERLNGVWDRLLLGLIGETIDPEDEITGARIVHSVHHEPGNFRFEVWLRSRDLEVADKVRSGVMTCLNDVPLKLTARDFTFKKHMSS